MTDGKDGSAEAGSPVGVDTGSGKAGESPINLDDYVPKSQYAALETKMGEMGSELGDARKFIGDLTPLLDSLDANPEVVEALREGKLDGELAKAIIEGRIGILEAKEVAKANEEIKNDMGADAHAQLNPEELAKQIMDKVQPLLAGVKEELKKDISEVKEVQEFEKNVAAFIAATPDFSEYADAITEYSSEHPEQENIEMVYHLIKGRALTAAAAADKAKSDVESSKDSLPPGTGSTRNAPASDGPSVEQFVKLGRSANTFG